MTSLLLLLVTCYPLPFICLCSNIITICTQTKHKTYHNTSHMCVCMYVWWKNNRLQDGNKYKGVVDAFTHVLKNEGFFAFWTGLHLLSLTCFPLFLWTDCSLSLSFVHNNFIQIILIFLSSNLYIFWKIEIDIKRFWCVLFEDSTSRHDHPHFHGADHSCI